MLLRYIGPSDAVEDIPGALGVIAKRGEPVDVPDDVAGRSPSPRLAAAMTELRDATAAHDHPRCIALRDEIAGWTAPDGTIHPPIDDGAGLLAQADMWEIAPKAKATAATKGEPQ